MKTMKKVLALVLAFALTIGGIAIFAHAEGLTTYEGSVLTYSLEPSKTTVAPGESFTVTIKMQTNYCAGVEGKEALFYTTGVVDTVTKDDITEGPVAEYYVTKTITANLASGAFPTGYATGYKAIVVSRLGTYNPDDPEEIVPPIVYTEPTAVYTVKFTVPATATIGSTIQFEMPAGSVASSSVSGRKALIFQKVVNNETNAVKTDTVASNYAETVNLPEPLVITVGVPVDKTLLLQAIETLPAIGQDEATSATWTAYTDALAAANTVYNDDKATQTAVDSAKGALLDAIAGVTRLGDCNYTDLDAAIDDYDALNLDSFTPASVTASDVTAKYNEAKAVTRGMLADEAGVNQGVINAAATALSDAIAALIEKADKNALEAAITAAQGKKEADYTPNSWTEADLANAIPAALDVYNDANATVAEVSGQVDALTAAMNALVAKANKTALAAAIATEPSIAQANATSASWTAYTDALDTANTIYNDPNATQDAVDNATTALTDAINGVTMLSACDYTALDKAIEDYEKLDLANYTPNSITASEVEAKYNVAKAVARNLLADEAGANQTTIDNAAAALNGAMVALVLKANKVPLETAIANVNALVEADYTPNSWAAADFTTVLAAAQVVLADDNATEAEVSEQVTAIETAIGKLVVKADKTALYTAIENASNLDEANYTPNSWTAADLANVIASAQNVYDDGNATDAQITNAINALTNAVNTLVAKANKDELNAAIITLPTVAQANATNASWTAYTDALAAAQLVAADENATQTEVDTAKNNLLAAIDGVVALSACNYTALDQAISAYEALTLANYTPASVTASDVTAKYDAAKAVTRDMLADEDGVNQGVIDAAATALSEAIAALDLKADKTALGEAIGIAQGKVEADYTPNSWTEANLATVIDAATVVYNDENATAAQITAQISAINTAIGKLVAKADKTALAAAIATVPSINQPEATSASWTAYTDALDTANTVYNDANATQAAVNAATDDLIAATNAVTKLADCDYTALDTAIGNYEALTLTDYTPNSVTASDVTAKYNAAKAVTRNMLADEAGANQNTITNAATALANAIAALAPKGDKTELIAEIAAAPDMTEDNATEASWAAYQTELVEAQAVVDDENADQTAVNTAKAELIAAKELVARDLCDYTALDAALALVPAKDASEYTEATWSVYAAAKLAAEQVDRNLINNKAGTNQAIVDEAAANLVTAYNRLRGNGCSITSFTCTQEHYMRGDVATFAFVTKAQGYAKIQVLHDGVTLTYERKNNAVQDIVKNNDGTETWYINIKIYNNGEFTYSARAKVFNADGGWDTDYIDFFGETSTGDDAEVKSAAAIFNDVEVTTVTTNDYVILRAVAGKDTQRLRFVDADRNTTRTLSTPKSVNGDGTKVFEFSRKLAEARDYTYLIDTADSTNKWTRSDKTIELTVTKYVKPQVLPTTGDIKDAVISVDASPRVLRFSPQTFTVVTDKNVSGFRLVDAAGNVAATQRADGVTEGDQTTWTLTKYYSAAGTVTYKVMALLGSSWVDSGKTVTFTVAY